MKHTVMAIHNYLMLWLIRMNFVQSAYDPLMVRLWFRGGLPCIIS